MRMLFTSFQPGPQISVIGRGDLAPCMGIDRSCQQRVELIWSF